MKNLIFLFCFLVTFTLFAQRPVSTVDSVAALKLLDPRPNTVAQTKGYYAPGDGGHGTWILTNTVSGINNVNKVTNNIIAGFSWHLIPEAPLNLRQFGITNSVTGLPATNYTVATNYAATFGPGRFVGTNIFDGVFQANSNVVIKGQSPWVDVVAFGADPTGVADSTIAIQAAINSFGTNNTMRSGRLLMNGGFVITNTLIFDRKSVEVMGAGWGSSTATLPGGSYLKWNGPTNLPMIRVSRSYGFRLRDMRFIGNTTNRPNAAISMYQLSADGNANQHNAFENIQIGNLEGFDSDEGMQFNYGIIFEGDNLNNDENMFRNVRIKSCGTGVKISNSQNGINSFHHLAVLNCSTNGFQCGSVAYLRDCFFSGNPVDLLIDVDGAVIRAQNFQSENSGRLADINPTGQGGLVIEGGYWQVSTNLNADAKVIKGNYPWDLALVIKNFRFLPVDGYAGATPIIDMTHSSAKKRYMEFKNVDDISTNNFLVASVEHVDSFGVIEFVNRTEAWRGVYGSGRGNNFSFAPRKEWQVGPNVVGTGNLSTSTNLSASGTLTVTSNANFLSTITVQTNSQVGSGGTVGQVGIGRSPTSGWRLDIYDNSNGQAGILLEDDGNDVPRLGFSEKSSTSGQRAWDIIAEENAFSMWAKADDLLTGNRWLKVTRSGTSPTLATIYSSSGLSVRNVADTDYGPIAASSGTFSGPNIFTPSSLQTIASGAQASANATTIIVVGSGGAITLDGTTAIVDGSNGQILIVVGTDDTNTVTVNDGANTNLGGNRVLGAGDRLTLQWLTVSGVWEEMFFQNN